MIKVSVMYPAGEGKTFDMDYYCNKHMQLARGLVGSALKKMEVEQGLSGGEPGSAPIYAAMGHLFFDSMDDFAASFPSHMDTLVADIPNYTNISPVIQISEVKI